MGRFEVIIEEAVALGGGEGLDLALVVGSAVDLVGRGSAGPEAYWSAATGVCAKA